MVLPFSENTGLDHFTEIAPHLCTSPAVLPFFRGAAIHAAVEADLRIARRHRLRCGWWHGEFTVRYGAGRVSYFILIAVLLVLL